MRAASCFRAAVLSAAGLAMMAAGGGAPAAPQAGRDAGATPAAPAWAYGLGAADASCSQAKDDGAQLHVAGSSAAFTRAQVGDCFAVADWFPNDHPAMPEIVSHGRKPDVEACAFCHSPNGEGRPDNAALAGLTLPYFEKQMRDFKTGARASVAPDAETLQMIGFAKAMSDDEIDAAAEYFGGLQAKPWIKVVESDRAPKTRDAGGVRVALGDGETEPLGQRIVEVPADAEAALLHNPRTGIIAYVPVGSVAKGKQMVEYGGDQTIECDNCHGPTLKGLGVNPPIAGRSPSYTARQMYDIQQGVRKGSWVGPMTDVVEKLTSDDIVAISAYLATLAP